jgi:hypothetical protein
MLSKIINVRKTPILYFEFPYEKIDPLRFQLQIFAFDTSKEVGKPIDTGSSARSSNLILPMVDHLLGRYSVDLLGTHEIHVAA